MALSEDLKEKILSDFHTGEFSQRELAQNHSVGIGTINRLTKGLTAKNGTLVCDSVVTTIKQNELMEQIGTLGTSERNSVQKAIQDKLRRTNLVYGLAEKALGHIDSALSKTIKDEEGKYTEELIEHSSKDIKEYVEAIDKASITLGVNDRHSQKIDISNTNAQIEQKVIKVEYN